jgi:hypothetical protein
MIKGKKRLHYAVSAVGLGVKWSFEKVNEVGVFWVRKVKRVWI